MDVWDELSSASRRLWKDPAFTLKSVLLLGAGVGLSACLITILDSILLRPLTVDPDDRVVLVRTQSQDGRYTNSYFSGHDWKLLQRGSAGIERMALVDDGSHSDLVYVFSDEPDLVQGANVSADFFPLLQLRPLLGRTLQADDAGRDVVVVSRRFWVSHLGGRKDALGSQVLLNGRSHAVVGVLDDDYRQPSPQGGWVDVWRPLGQVTGDFHVAGRIVARLSPGATLATVEQGMDRLYQDQIRNPASRLDRLTLTSLHADEVERTRTFLLFLTFAGLLLLLITAANTAGLATVRRIRRARDAALRQALGAGSGRLLRENLWEGGLVGTAASLVALASVLSLSRLIARFLPEDFPRLSEVGATSGAIAFAVVASLLAGLIVGWIAARKSNADLTPLLGGNRGSWSDRGGLRRLGSAVVAEAAVCAALLLSTGLLVRSFLNITSVPMGYRIEGIGSAEIHLPFEKADGASGFFRALTEQAALLPGVESAAVASSVPLRPRDYRMSSGWRKRCIGPGFFRTLGARLLEGRDFLPSDDEASEPVAILSRAAALSAFPDGRALGRLVEDRYRVVGIVDDLRYLAPDADPLPAIYVHDSQTKEPRMALLVRTSRDPLEALSHLESIVQRLDPRQPVKHVHRLRDLYQASDAIEERRTMLSLLFLFAAAGAVLAGFGVFVACSSAAASRRREYGIRLAVGAQRRDILVRVLRHGTRLTAFGFFVGLGLSLATTRLLSTFLYGVSAEDPATAVVVCAAVLLMGLAGGAAPALAAIRVDPWSVLGSE